MGAISPPPARACTSYNADTVVGNSVRPLPVVLYGITLVPLAEELRAADPGRLTPFYTENVELYGLEWRSSHILKLIVYKGADRGCLLVPSKSLSIADSPNQKESTKR